MGQVIVFRGLPARGYHKLGCAPCFSSLLCPPSFAQTTAQALARRVAADLAALNGSVTLSAWQRAHPKENVQPSAYNLPDDFSSRWCARSVIRFAVPGSQEFTRIALFYAPTDTLLDKVSLQDVVLQAYLYEVTNISSAAELANAMARELTASWGPPSHLPRNDRDDFQGSALWEPALAWERQGSPLSI